MSPTLTVTAWRDYDLDACALPGMFLGDIALTGPVDQECDRLWDMGARRVRVPGVVDLTATAATASATINSARAVQALSVIRDLTARAVLVEWSLRVDPEDEETSRILGHLQPPQRIEGPDEPAADEALRVWRGAHYLGKCLWRQGPGFVQIRDRRWGDLRRFTADEPHYREAIARLAYGGAAASVAPDALADFHQERLVLQVGELEWWLPYRVNRWVQEAMAI
ncbi:DUF5825 family protein [Streptomyces sp. NPDC059743]|uniref:DUF5825 family protein n=1 Tax=Streptomyces sp. NPDC059743 TaxID=3346928 RepID=UPI00364B3077